MITSNTQQPIQPHEVVKIGTDFILLVKLGVLLKDLRRTPRDNKTKRDKLYLEMQEISEKLFIENLMLDVEIYENFESERPKKQSESFDSIFKRILNNRIQWDEIGADERNERHEQHKSWLECQVIEFINESKKEAA